MKLSIFFIILVIVPIIFFGTISSNVKEVNIVEQNVYKPEVKKEDNNNYDKVVALTFDDGPSKYTNDIIDTLSKYNVTATFFVIGIIMLVLIWASAICEGVLLVKKFISRDSKGKRLK